MVARVKKQRITFKGYVNIVKSWFWKLRDKPSEKEVYVDKFRRTMADMTALISALDTALLEHMSRTQRRQFWVDFCKYKQMRPEIFDVLIENNDIGVIVRRYFDGTYGERSKGKVKRKNKPNGSKAA